MLQKYRYKIITNNLINEKQQKNKGNRLHKNVKKGVSKLNQPALIEF